MNQRLRKALMTALCAAAAMSPAVAMAETWDYRQCVEFARANNIDLRKALLSEQTAATDLDEAKAQWQPSLDFATTHTYSNLPWGEGSKNGYSSSYGLNAGWTVWNGGQRENTIKRNSTQVEIARTNTTDVMRTLETDLLQVYINILYARESISIYEEALKLSTAQAERAHALMEAGRISRVDYAQLKSQQEQDSYALVNARGTYDTRRMELKKLLELGIDTQIELADIEVTAEQILAALPPVEESYRLALATDARLQGLELAEETADRDIDIARASQMPKIALGAGIGTGYNAPGQSFGPAIKRALNESLGVTLSVPILDNRKTRSAVARAKIQKLDAELDIDRRRTEISQLVENWFIDTRSAQSRYKAAVEQLASAELTAELTDEKFGLGLVNPIELMTAHNALTEARHTLLQSRYMALLGRKMIDFYRDSRIEL